MQEHKEEIIIKRKSGGHAAHHGGAWKVAYADFVTAMMAFFMTMWLVGMKKDIKEAVAAYFKDPGAFQTQGKGDIGKAGSGILPGASSLKSTGIDAASARQALKEQMQKAAKRLGDELAKATSMKGLEKQIEITMTSEGMRIEFLDNENSTFFDSGSAKMKPETERLMGLVAVELGRLDRPIVFEGHTDRQPYANHLGYTNWDLSVERANSARRVMQGSGLGFQLVKEVRGYADLRPRLVDKPFDPRNRRVSIVVPYDTAGQ